MNPLTRQGGAIQPINYAIPATADANGNATFTFDAVALSNTWTLTLNCAFAPDTARFTAATGASNFGQFKGGNSWGPIQLQGGDRLQVTATGLVAGTQYQMTGQGSCETVADPGIVYPSPYADTVTTSTEQLYLGQVKLSKTGPGNFAIATVPLSASYRSIYLAITGTTGSPSAYTYYGVGNMTNLTYNSIVLPYTTQPNQVVVRIPTLSLTDTMLTLYVTLASGQSFSNLLFSYGADLANVDTAIYTEGTLDVTVANTSPIPVTISSGGGSTNVTTISGSTTTVSNNVAVTPSNTSGTPLWVESVSGSVVTPSNTSGAPLYVTGNGSTASANAIAVTNVYSGVVQPLQVSPYGGSFTVTPSNTSGTPLWVESVSGSTTAVTNTAATPLNVQGVAGGVAVPVSGTVTPSNTSGTPLWVESVSGSTVAVTPSIVAGTSSAPLEVYQVGGKSKSGVTTTATTATTILTGLTAGYAWRLHSITMEYTGTASTTPVQALLRLAGSGAPFTVDLAVLIYPYQTTIFLGGLLIPYVASETVTITNSTTTSTNFTLFYDTVTIPTIS